MENPIGIETNALEVGSLAMSSCNSLENPIGIETATPYADLTEEEKLQLIGKPDRD